MRNQHTSIAEERQFITKEFADSLAGKKPAPYLRLHDPVQKALAENLASAEIQEQGLREYYKRRIHFWREVSLAGMPRAGRAMDECYALLFESVFDLAEADPAWALEVLADKSALELPTEALSHLGAQTVGGSVHHTALVPAFTRLYAQWRETDRNWHNEVYVDLSSRPTGSTVR